MNYYLEALKKYAVFHGRAHRAEFWWFVLFNAIFSFALNITFGARVGVPEESVSSASPLAILPAIYGLAVLLPAIGVSIRRLHDTNRSGWWLLIALFPIVGAIVLIVFYAQAGDAGENQFGADPKAAVPGMDV